MTSIDELTADWRAQGAYRAAPALADGFAAPVWTAIDMDVFVPHWRDLARSSVAPNPFQEDGFVLPGLRQFDPDGQIALAHLVVHGRLVGLLPICTARTYHRRPLPHLAGWQHANSFCGEPLIAPGYEEAFWSALLAWGDQADGYALFLHMGDLPAEGAVLEALRRVAARDGRTVRTVHREERAVLVHGPSPQAHLAAAASKKRRKEFARRRRRLEDQGDVRVERSDNGQGIEAWIADFLALERAGWKGNEGSALACDPRTEFLFRESLASAAQSSRLQRLSLTLDGRPIAMLATFIAPPAAFSFKTAYDETLAQFSPGVLLQIENLALLEREDIAYCDSCAAPDHPMIDHLWRDRRTMVKVSVPIGGPIRRRLGSLITGFEARRWKDRS